MKILKIKSLFKKGKRKEGEREARKEGKKRKEGKEKEKKV